MSRRRLSRPRLALRYRPGWTEVTRSGRQIGPRPVLALQRTPDPTCPYCGGHGEIPCGPPDDPDSAPCECTPFAPLLKLRLPRIVARLTTAITYRRNRHLYSNEPPF